MKRAILILLSVALAVAVTGCGNKKSAVSEPVSEQKETEKVTVKETQIPDVLPEQSAEPTKAATEQTEEKTESEQEQKTEIPEDKTTDKEKTQQNQQQEQPSEQKAEQKQPSEDKPQKKPVQDVPVSSPDGNDAENEHNEPVSEPDKSEEKAYSPQKVVSLATAKTKAAGKILLTENLDRLFADGQISKEEYKEYYPYDGAGYFSVFVQTDLNQASTTSGAKLTSEDGIAQYIADLLALESGAYFLIEYAGTYDNGGTNCYEFRCYRA